MVTERDNIHVAVLFLSLSAISRTGVDFATAAKRLPLFVSYIQLKMRFLFVSG